MTSQNTPLLYSCPNKRRKYSFSGRQRLVNEVESQRIDTNYLFFLNTLPLRIYSISATFKRALTTRAAANK